MATNIDPTIEHLDFTPDPVVCECLDCQGHPGRQCRDLATHCVSVHLFGGCQNKDITLDGFVSQLLCRQCMNGRGAKVSELVFHSHQVFRRMGRFLHCTGCQMPVTKAVNLWKARAL
ncbi:MAG: hypothetical protein CK431_04430 [Mycobacterium sp.]|nr:MAG: hypothetical protein CK431_04430 [Mycobacterium sp.]